MTRGYWAAWDYPWWCGAAVPDGVSVHLVHDWRERDGDRMLARGAGPSSLAFVDKRRGRVRGVLLVDGAGHVLEVNVAPACRRRGVARSLYRLARAWGLDLVSGERCTAAGAALAAALDGVTEVVPGIRCY